jgi:hypothetical protein
LWKLVRRASTFGDWGTVSFFLGLTPPAPVPAPPSLLADPEFPIHEVETWVRIRVRVRVRI